MVKKDFTNKLSSDSDKKRIQNLLLEKESLKKTVEDLKHVINHEKNENNSSEIEFKDIKIVRNMRDDFNYLYEDIEELSEDIFKNGQLQSILITSDNFLIAGYRRYYAIKKLITDNKHNGLVNVVRLDKKFKEIGIEAFDKLQIAENEQRKSIDNFQRAKLYHEYFMIPMSVTDIGLIFDLTKSIITMFLSIHSLDSNLKRLLKEIQHYGMSKKKFDGLNKTSKDRVHEVIGIKTLYNISKGKTIKEQTDAFLEKFSSKLSDSELSEFGVKPVKPVKVSEFQKLSEKNITDLDKMVKKYPEKAERIERAKKEITKILKGLEK